MSSQVFDAPRRELNARRAETVERLFEAGWEELRTVGHETLTIRTVASRAGVSPATAYTYLASKNHLFTELFWRYLADDEQREPVGEGVVDRTQSVTRRMAQRLADAPELAAAVTPALLSSDPDVDRLRLRIGGEIADRFARALGAGHEPAVLDALVMAFSGALLQAGMGVLTYTEMGERLDGVVATILKGNAS